MYRIIFRIKVTAPSQTNAMRVSDHMLNLDPATATEFFAGLFLNRQIAIDTTPRAYPLFVHIFRVSELVILRHNTRADVTSCQRYAVFAFWRWRSVSRFLL
jgi:hypothetical protein